jgi:hypothetical protein
MAHQNVIMHLIPNLIAKKKKLTYQNEIETEKVVQKQVDLIIQNESRKQI